MGDGCGCFGVSRNLVASFPWKWWTQLNLVSPIQIAIVFHQSWCKCSRNIAPDLDVWHGTTSSVFHLEECTSNSCRTPRTEWSRHSKGNPTVNGWTLFWGRVGSESTHRRPEDPSCSHSWKWRPRPSHCARPQPLRCPYPECIKLTRFRWFKINRPRYLQWFVASPKHQQPSTTH